MMTYSAFCLLLVAMTSQTLASENDTQQNESTIEVDPASFEQYTSMSPQFAPFKKQYDDYLELRYTSPTSGYIQTPDVRAGEWIYTKPEVVNITSHLSVEIPANRVLFLTVAPNIPGLSSPEIDDMSDLNVPVMCKHHMGFHFDLIFFAPSRQCWSTSQFPRAFSNSNFLQVVFMQRSKQDPKDKTIFHHQFWFKIAVREYTNRSTDVTWYKSDEFHWRSRAFRVLFSFHESKNLLSKPQEKTHPNVFDCSVAQYKDFLQHLRCNYVEECTDGRDEQGCDYTSRKCGPRQILLDGRCYFFSGLRPRISWLDAWMDCDVRGGYLASLNTPEEWKSVSKLLLKLSFITMFIGLRFQAPSSFPFMYASNVPVWIDGTAAYLRYSKNDFKYSCSVIYKWAFQADGGYMNAFSYDCTQKEPLGAYLCEMEPKYANEPTSPYDFINPPQLLFSKWAIMNALKCPAGHIIPEYLACDMRSECLPADTEYCLPSVTKPHSPMYKCANGVGSVSYTVLCDYRPDCVDTSDEDFCVFKPCALGTFDCGSKQCVDGNAVCDNVHGDCANGADETWCNFKRIQHTAVERPVTVSVDFGKIRYSTSIFRYCEKYEVSCQSDRLCLPYALRCNGVNDCPGKEDEFGCDEYNCNGNFRCRGTRICLYSGDVCDHTKHCPLGDDEEGCGFHFSCPKNCTCSGYSAFCFKPFGGNKIDRIRYLNARGSGVSFTSVSNYSMLVHLDLAQCGISRLPKANLPNLRFLDLSENSLNYVNYTFFHGTKNLRVFLLRQNPLESTLFVNPLEADAVFKSLQILDLSGIAISTFSMMTLASFTHLQTLNLSKSGIDRISDSAEGILSELKLLDLRGCPVTQFQSNVFKGLRNLRQVYGDNYKLCCQALLPEGFNSLNCVAPTDEISSCEALLKADIYRVLLSIFAVLAITGNKCSFIYRVLINKARSDLGFGVFVTHLNVSDFFMGIYLAIIGVVDYIYQGSYIWQDVAWKSSTACNIAGILSMLSNEVSAFLICLITLDRFLVLHFPFGNLRFRQKSAHIACFVVWSVGFIIASIPLLPGLSHWQFYNQNGICIPLPITQSDFPGHVYSFGIMIVLNFVLFVFIALGQLSIYHSVRSNSMTDSETIQRSKDLTIARRLITIAVSDFACWFPIGLLGLLASGGMAIPGEVNVATAVVVLPLNAVLNPFLYTFNMVQERRRLEKEKRLQKILSSAQRQARGR